VRSWADRIYYAVNNRRRQFERDVIVDRWARWNWNALWVPQPLTYGHYERTPQWYDERPEDAWKKAQPVEIPEAVLAVERRSFEQGLARQKRQANYQKQLLIIRSPQKPKKPPRPKHLCQRCPVDLFEDMCTGSPMPPIRRLYLKNGQVVHYGCLEPLELTDPEHHFAEQIAAKLVLQKFLALEDELRKLGIPCVS
jgi:hypothetical protein